MNISRFNDLPVELFHSLFSYFSAHEIFYTFANLSSYIDSILVSYTDYRINFQAITRFNFDLVCQNIVPDQVIALTLSDDEHTPGLVSLFLSRVQIHQFIHLRALKLIDIGPDIWANTIMQMATLKELRSFSFYIPHRTSPWICNLLATHVIYLEKSLFDIYAPILPQLYYLRLTCGDLLKSIQFPYLRHLILEQTNIDVIQHISSAAPQIQTLDTSLSLNMSPTELILPISQLHRLILRIQNVTVSMNGLEQMMSNLPRLRHLALVCHCDMDVVDGKNWERIAKNLYTFKFNFTFDDKIELEQLDSFRTSFWLNDKKWFVGCIDKQFFSMPTLNPIPTEISCTSHLPQYTTYPDIRSSYHHVHELVMTRYANYLNNHFPNVQTIILRNPPPLITIKNVINLCQIRNMALLRLRKNFPIKSLINKMPNLCELSIKCDIENFLKQIHYQVLDKIRTLRIHEFDFFTNLDDDNTKNLFTVFPHVKHLHISEQCSIIEISDCLHRFKYLSTASFCHSKSSFHFKKNQHRLHLQSKLDRIRCEEGLNFTYRFDSKRIYMWIESQANHILI